MASFYLNSNVDTAINESVINDAFGSIYTTIISNIQKALWKGLSWINDSVIDQSFNISKYNIMAHNSYIKLPKELSHVKQVLINIQNIILH